MEGIFIFIVAILLAVILITAFLIFRKITELKKDDSRDNSALILQQQINQLSESLDRKLGETRNILDQKLTENFNISKNQLEDSVRFVQGISKESREVLNEVSRQSQQLIRQVTERLTKLDETNRQVVEFSSQLKNLQDILKNPKQRGVLGEYYLEETLKNVLPPNLYQMQYSFNDGTIVDAAIFVKDKIIPVDSKFSLEKYEKLLNSSDKKERERLRKEFRNDLKNRIDETAKYVKTEEGTVDFAFMFIPSESIYYDLLVDKVGSRDIVEYAFKEKHVIIVSPTSFLAYLQTVLQGLRMLQIEESAKEIRKNVEKLARHLGSYEDCFRKVGTSLSTTVNHFNRAGKEWRKIDKDIMKIAEEKEKTKLGEVAELEKPRLPVFI